MTLKCAKINTLKRHPVHVLVSECRTSNHTTIRIWQATIQCTRAKCRLRYSATPHAHTSGRHRFIQTNKTSLPCCFREPHSVQGNNYSPAKAYVMLQSNLCTRNLPLPGFPSQLPAQFSTLSQTYKIEHREADLESPRTAGTAGRTATYYMAGLQ